MTKPTFTPTCQPFKPAIVAGYISMLLGVLFCITYFDRPLAEYIHHVMHVKIASFAYSSQTHAVLESLSKSPLVLEILAFIIVVLSLTKPYQLRLYHLRNIILLVAINATIIRVSAKIVFGRTWPETWTNNNLSWISHGVEAFYPFSLSAGFHSFPSGHTLLTFTFASLFWQCFPRFKLVWIFAMLAVVLGQLLQNYHYLGDILAGATLGLLVSQLSINYYCHNKNFRHKKGPFNRS
ncbi:phosphatase PAP2 family protein [Shewanella sp. MMG014]|uniref:phosphatase PAP2 family protein n=1 Tax=Shewanella sp. MMG014 TaxID=2822691 RepID=UPI001B385F66|nr:phosphatase PAP2 family protein [Shewanella sp. MMG014]MBQ4888806.1 phosphatase PAP2 family protein [Shewanella sp. MMG014]